MNIGILGAGNIGATLATRLSAGAHQVRIANSRGPETISPDLLVNGAQAVTARQVVEGVDALVVSIPLSALADIRPLIDALPKHAVVLDTSNYYPMRDGNIEALDGGQTESVWVAEQLGRPVVKAWNSILAHSFATKHRPAGDADRIALPVSADRDADRQVGIALVEETGFDAFDAGPLADSWRQQPGAPAYCTDLTRQELPTALAAAAITRSPRRRDLVMTVIAELSKDPDANLDGNALVQINRVLYTP